jgi:RNA polymerase sigma factor (sigma-70 family)
MEKRESNMTKLSDADLALLAADEKNFEAIIELQLRYGKYVYWHVMKSVHDVAYANDISYRTFIEARKSFVRGKYKEDGKIVNFLYRIARNIHNHDLRDKELHAEVELTEELLEQCDIADDANEVLKEEVLFRQQLLLIGRALHECSRKERLAFILYFVKGWEWVDIGKRLGNISWDSARKDAFRCRKHIWKLLGKMPCDDLIFPIKGGNLSNW